MSFRVAFLVGQDNESTRQSIEAVCALEGVTPVGILLDTHRPSLKLRIRNLYRNLAREGWAYGFRRLAIAILEKLKVHAVNTFVDPNETSQLLRRAFPSICWTLEELAARRQSQSGQRRRGSPWTQSRPGDYPRNQNSQACHFLDSRTGLGESPQGQPA